MSTPEKISPAKGGRDSSLREEQALCNRAIESGSYDAMSDQAWIALCEHVATEARQTDAKEPGEALPDGRAAHPGDPGSR
ncbi:MAG TPA: hypothetical protein PLF51_02110 [Candidatus Hydrogenedentes bacterium]|nr:hypothetical protein [Candidatus Hydrogenedentota bacterium]